MMVIACSCCRHFIPGKVPWKRSIEREEERKYILYHSLTFNLKYKFYKYKLNKVLIYLASSWSTNIPG